MQMANSGGRLPRPEGYKDIHFHPPAPTLHLGERLDNDPNGTRYGCFLPDLAGLARRSPAPTSQRLDNVLRPDSQGS